jgi:monomeric sarcosine oxidase
MPQASHRSSLRIAVIGAGAFGGWTALELARRGARVALFDAWGPGNSRASSGGETRIIRATYGPDRIYTRMAARSLKLWRKFEARSRLELFHPTGVLWMASDRDAYEKAALPILRDEGVRFKVLHAKALAKRFPQVNFDGIRWAIFESEGGYLLARQACDAVRRAFVRAGGEYQQLSITPGPVQHGALRSVNVSGSPAFRADRWLFACGPWLGGLFPHVLGPLIRATRQEVIFFGPMPDERRFNEGRMPVWIDYGESKFYGIPGNQGRGLKIASDIRGAPFEPTRGDRNPSEEGIQAARAYLEFRFPAMRGAPLVESRVCQYEQSPDGHFILDRHPEARNVWIAGGGSGHGFKHGPALGEMAADMILEGSPAPAEFALSRFSAMGLLERVSDPP